MRGRRAVRSSHWPGVSRGLENSASKVSRMTSLAVLPLWAATASICRSVSAVSRTVRVLRSAAGSDIMESVFQSARPGKPCGAWRIDLASLKRTDKPIGKRASWPRWAGRITWSGRELRRLRDERVMLSLVPKNGFGHTGPGLRRFDATCSMSVLHSPHPQGGKSPIAGCLCVRPIQPGKVRPSQY